jgi:hypothetical protein
MVADTQDKAAAVEAAMEAEGVSTSTPMQQDYFGFGEVHEVTLPDGISKIEHKALNEGARRRYLNREIRVQRASGDMLMKMATGDELHVLLEEAISGWNLVREGRPIAFSKGSKGSTLELFLSSASPQIVDIIVKDVRKHYPWLLADVTVEGIDEQIEELKEMRAKLLREEEGNGTSSPA